MAEEKKTPQTERKAQADRKSHTGDEKRKPKPRNDKPTVTFTDFAAI